MIYWGMAILLLLGWMITVGAVNLFSQTQLAGQSPDQQPLCSILIPARNEEDTIGKLLSDLSEQTYENLEVVIYDDQSVDATFQTVEHWASENNEIRILKGGGIPSNWRSGKLYACDQLAAAAKGEYLLFLDADVRVQKHFTEQIIDYLQRSEIHMVSVFPQQEMRSLGERITVPLMNWILVSLLPLPLVRLLPFPSLSAANGQCMLFKARNYRQNRWHALNRREMVEDIAIARSMKRRGFKIQTLLGSKQITCRMYKSYQEAVVGFARNIQAYFGDSYVILFLFTLLIFGGIIPAYAVFGLCGLAVYSVGLSTTVIFSSRASGQSVLLNLLLLLPRLLSLIHIACLSVYNSMLKRTYWKGRKIDLT